MPFTLAPAEPQRSKLLPIDMDYVTDVMVRLLRIPSPSGRTDHVMQLVGEEIAALGMPFELTRRGVLRGELCGEGGPGSADRAIIVHADTIGCMVKELKDNGRLTLVPIGTHSARFAEGARVKIFVDDLERTYTGTVLPLKASGHRWGDDVDTQGVGWEQVEVRVDEVVHDAGGLAALGIDVGDFVAFDAHPVITPSGYVKSRHLDDKAGIAAALGAFKSLIDHGAVLPVNAHLLVTIAEEVGLGASHGLDADVAEMVSIDTSVVALGQASTEHTVNIASQDSSGPFDYHLVRRLAGLCRYHGIDYRRDVYGYYRSDAASALEAGVETRAALIGFGIDASHGHERTHLDGVRRVAELIAVYLQTDLTFRHWDTAPVGELKDFPSTLVQPADDLGPR
ncbi:MAG: osmoprotectant NAGGN system M42 family peptidase [Actinobacteria bacterium]|nr:osmoprotectant NAGGN system M42 family peptidase [Actinomycetota bacterium]